MHKIQFGVRYSETDQMGVVYHANYLIWFDMARTAQMESLGFSYQEVEDLGAYWVIRDAQVKYHKPVRFPEEVCVEVKCVFYNGLRIRHQYAVFVGEELRISGSTELINVDQKTFRPTNFKKVDLSKHEKLLEVVETET